MKLLYSLTVPGGLLVLAAVAFVRWAAPETVAAVLRLYPYAVLAAGLLLGWRFNRSRLVLAVLLLALADRTLARLALPPGSAAMTEAARVVFQATAVLLPLNLAGFSLLAERGTWLRRGLLGLGFVGAQALGVAGAAYFASGRVAVLLEHSFVDPRWAGWTRLGQPALAAFGLAVALLAVRSFLTRKALDAAFLWAVVAAFLGAHAALLRQGYGGHALQSLPGVGGQVLGGLGEGGQAATVYFSTAGLILAIAVIETSYAMAYRDELTRLPARRALNEALGQLGSQYAVAMVDVDHFKKFNDTYGHEVGDQVLQMVAARLEQVSGGGRAFRYGGEEFSVLFPGQPVEEALPHLEALRQSIEASQFVIRGGNRPRRKPKKPRAATGSRRQVAITVSIGAAQPDARRPTPELVIQAADQALYRAKKAGRNQVKA